MKKKLSSLLLALALAMQAGAAPAAEPDYATGAPWPDIDLEGVVTRDMKASLKDNFALAVNKEKILALKIPKGHAEGGTMMDLQLKQIEDLKGMFLGREPDGHDAKLAYALFQLMMDWKSRNAQGAAPLKKAVDAIEAAGTVDALNAYFLKTPVEDQIARLWIAGSEASFDDASRNVLLTGACPLVLEDAAEYGKLTAYGEVKKKAYSELARKMLARLGYAEKAALQKIENCLAFEAMLAPAMLTSEQKKGPDYARLINNRFSHEKLAKAQAACPFWPGLRMPATPKPKNTSSWSPASWKGSAGSTRRRTLP